MSSRAYDDADISSNDEPFDEANEPCRTFYDEDMIWVPPDAANINNNTDHSLTTWDNDDDDCVDGVSVSYNFEEGKQRALEAVMDGRFKNLVSQLLEKVGADNFDGQGGRWVDIVTLLAWQAALFIKPDAIEAKDMDPARYVKIKCIATGSPTESQLIKGLVFKKHAAHKHMVVKHKNPRLLLIKGLLDQSSSSSGLSSFNSMTISQDRDNLEVLLENFRYCHPNVILMEKSTSHDVVDWIVKSGVTLVLDMKLHRWERVARCTSSPILSSTTMFSQEMGLCDSVYFEKFVEDHAIVGEGEKKPSKTLMFLEGCPKHLGCTILLKGSHTEKLKIIKCVVQCAVVMAYHFIVETSFLVNQKAMFSTFSHGTEAGISPSQEAVPEGSSTEVKGSLKEEPLHHNHSQPLSSFSEAKAVDYKEDISSVLDSESILVWVSAQNASKGTICEQNHFTHIKFYKDFDVPLHKFFLDNLFSQSYWCEECHELPEAHFHYYAHDSKRLTIQVKRLENKAEFPGKSEGRLWMWSRCGKCKPSKKVVTKRVLVATAAHGLSFGKFLELSFSSRSSFDEVPSCGHSLQKNFLYFFGYEYVVTAKTGFNSSPFCPCIFSNILWSL